MQTRQVWRGVASLCLLSLLTACASSPIKTQTVTVYVPQTVKVPQAFTAPIAQPSIPAKPSNGDLVHYIVELQQALDQANARLKAIAGLD